MYYISLLQKGVRWKSNVFYQIHLHNGEPDTMAIASMAYACNTATRTEREREKGGLTIKQAARKIPQDQLLQREKKKKREES